MKKHILIFLSILSLAPCFAMAEGDQLFDKKAVSDNAFTGLDVGVAKKKETKTKNEFDYTPQVNNNSDKKKDESAAIIPGGDTNVDSKAATSNQDHSQIQAKGTAPSIEPNETQDVREQLKREEVVEEQKKPVEETPTQQLSNGAMSPEYYRSLIEQVKTQTEKATDTNNEYQSNNKVINTKVTKDNRF